MVSARLYGVRACVRSEAVAAMTETPDLLDLLGAMGDYFDARRELNHQMDTYSGYSFDYFGRHYVENVERAYERVQLEWVKLQEVRA